MKISILFCCLVVATIATPTTLTLHSKWNEFKSAYGRTYQRADEEKKRNEIFAENVKKIEEHNKLYEQGLVTYEMAVNKFADWTNEEFVAYLTKYPRVQQKSLFTFQTPLNVDLPDALDWRNNGSVTPVKDQGNCGSCWAFSATGALEGQSALRKGKLVSLSEQELVDCSKKNGGCSGGLKDLAFLYVKQYGLRSEEEYLFEGIDGPCRRFNKTEAIRASGYVDIESGNELDLQQAIVAVGPISVAVDASNWSFYDKGIFNGKCRSSSPSLNHEVLLVGYGSDDQGQDYWIVKNSWGKYWGENGYIRLPRHKNACGVATEASYPIVA